MMIKLQKLNLDLNLRPQNLNYNDYYNLAMNMKN